MSGSDGSQAIESSDDDQAETMEQAELRKTIAEADLKELELARERGQVVAIEDARRTFSNLAKAMQTKILAWPTKMAPRLVGIKDRDPIRAILDREARMLCHDLATIQAKPIEKPEEAEGDGSSDG